MKCINCGSENILQDAWAEWSYDAQEWVLHSTQANFWCQTCDGETSYPNNEEVHEPVTIISAPRTPAEAALRFKAAIDCGIYYDQLLRKEPGLLNGGTLRLFRDDSLAEAIGWASR